MLEKLYQADLAATQHYTNIGNAYVLANEELKATIEAKIGDYEENRQQAIDNVNAAADIAKSVNEIWTSKAEDGSTFETIYQEYEEDIAAWVYEQDADEEGWQAFNLQFEETRGYLSEMSDLVEAWAEKEDAALSTQISNKITMIIAIFVAIIVIIAIFAVVMLIMILKGFKQIIASVEKLSEGDFVTPIDDSNRIAEFGNIGALMNGMRKKLQESLLQVVSLAGNVDNGAANTEKKIADSQRMSADISSAISDIAHGATSMAQDVQSTSDLTINIGTSVDSVLNSTNDNNDNGKIVYQNAENVKQQLIRLKESSETTDGIATQVSDSVNATAEVVEKISQAAEAIIGIASQTNLLALNASIEAARAGEAGKGFAVVADNIKGLAEESDAAAKEITDMLSEIISMSNQNKDLTAKIKDATASEAGELQEMEASFEEMMDLLRKTEEGNAAIIRLVESLNLDKDSVMNSVESLSSISQENAASTEETSASLEQLSYNMEDVVAQAGDLRQVADDLQRSVRFFRVSDDSFGGSEE